MKSSIQYTNLSGRKKNEDLIKSAKLSLMILWIAAIIITILTVSLWNSANIATIFRGAVDDRKGLFVDELLLSSSELGKNTMLINLNLNSKQDSNNEQPISLQHVIKPEVRKAVYNKIAERKVKKAASGLNEEGFSLKPVPE